MNFPLITIPDLAAVGAWLDEELGTNNGTHRPMYSMDGTICLNHWHKPADCIFATAITPEDLLADIRRQVAENDPLAKLRKEWEAMGKPDLNDKSPSTGANE